MPTLGSLFDGIAGFPHAASRAGITPVWASEIIPAAIAVSRRHFPSMRHLGDVTQVNGAEIEPVDVITFGSPCVALSVAGNREGLADERSGLFHEAIRIIREMQEATNGLYPTLAVWENVPGAFSSNKGRDFAAVLQSLVGGEVSVPRRGWTNAGVAFGPQGQAAWRVVDAQFWGVPQRRRRIILVYDPRTERAGQILFEPLGVSGDSAKGAEAGQGTAGDPADRSGASGEQLVAFTYNDHGQDAGPVSPTLRSFHDGGAGGVAIASGGAAHTVGIGSDPLWAKEVAQPITGRNGDPGVVVQPETFRQMEFGQYAVDARMGTGGNQVPVILQPLAIDMQQVTSPTNHTRPAPVAPTLHQNGGAHVIEPVAFALRGREEGAQPEVHGDGDTVGALRASEGGSSRDYVAFPIKDVSHAGKEYTSADGGLGVGDQNDPVFAPDTHGNAGVAMCYDPKDLGRRPAEFTDQSPALKARAGTGGVTSPSLESLPVTAFDVWHLRETENSNTLLSKNQGGYSLNYQNPVRIGYTVRRLTPLEAERLQGFLDGWTEWGVNEKGERVNLSDTARYKALGNSIAIPCFEWLMKRIAKVMGWTDAAQQTAAD